MKIFSIKNEKLSFFNRPIYVESSNEALSYVQNVLMSDSDRALVGLKDDLALYEIGEIDFTDGTVRGLKKPVKCADLASIFESIPEDKIPRTEREIDKALKWLDERVKTLEFNKKGEVRE